MKTIARRFLFTAAILAALPLLAGCPADENKPAAAADGGAKPVTSTETKADAGAAATASDAGAKPLAALDAGPAAATDAGATTTIASDGGTTTTTATDAGAPKPIGSAPKPVTAPR